MEEKNRKEKELISEKVSQNTRAIEQLTDMLKSLVDLHTKWQAEVRIMFRSGRMG